MPPERAYRFVAVVSDVTSGHMVRLPWDYARYGLDPDEQLVADAVRASASIPFFFRPFPLKLPEKGKVAVCTDGGMLSNFPINIFDRTRGKPRWPTFGIKLSARPPAGRWVDTWAPVPGPIPLAKALIATMMNAHDRTYMDDPSVCASTVFVDTDGVRSTDFGLAQQARDDLYERGRTAGQSFLADWDFDEYIRKYR
jgi:NTE family protein